MRIINNTGRCDVKRLDERERERVGSGSKRFIAALFLGILFLNIRDLIKLTRY